MEANAARRVAAVEIVDHDDLFDEEPRLLEQARSLMGRLPFEQLDLLVIGEIGKNYSGAGIDPNVVGRLLMEGAPEFESPRITRICALDLSPESHGNATGVGIAEADLQRIGRPYEQVGDVAQKTRGTGLGLSLVRHITEAHGGEIEVDSTPGKGSKFVLSLPLSGSAQQRITQTM